MKRIEVYTLIICGLFYFSEGKPCPEKTRPHKTRCEVYYKCMELPTKSHVWVPEKCEQGLIYEQNLKMCVLPGDDWECTLGDTMPNEKPKNDSNIINVSQQDKEAQRIKDADIYIVNNEREDSLILKDQAGGLEVVLDSDMSSSSSGSEEVNEDDEGSGNGGELVELDGFLQAENRETEDHMAEQQHEENEVAHAMKTTTMRTLMAAIPTTTTSQIDPQLTEHLQRLSQLIDGLKQTYQHKEQAQQELRPDQLNAFLAHFNINSKFNTLNPTAATDYNGSTMPTMTKVVPLASKNKTLLQEHLSNKLNPETKLMLTNTMPHRYGPSGFSNSQIVVNRPEGAVLFSLPPYGGDTHYGESHISEYTTTHDSPKISEETLKTVLELSKQMIATQNIPKVIPNPYYAQPILQPLYLPAAAFSGHAPGNPFASYFNNGNNNNADYDDNVGKYGSHTGGGSNSYGNKPYYGHKKTQRPGGGNSGGYGKPSTTIIHNNVIPVHVTSTNSGEKEVVDSYGYPPLGAGEVGNSNINHHNHMHAHHYENNKYVVTTMRPIISTTTMETHYAAQYPSPYSTEISVTTPRPTYEFQPTPSTIAEYYTPSPHLNEHNVNSLFQPPQRYPTIKYGDLPRPMDQGRPNQQQQSHSYYSPVDQSSLFPSQIDPSKIQIRPNAQKVESMEVESDNSGYGEQQQPSPPSQVFSYNFGNNDKPDIGNQYLSSSTNNKYLPRPQGSSNYGANKPKYPSFGQSSSAGSSSSAYPDATQLVNVGGNFISYDVFKNTFLPLLGQPSTENIEVITCAAGIRQPNTTDCTRYYVCSKKDGKVLSYSCPPYTAFNAQTRICDARTYSMCSPDAILSSYTVNENKRIQMEALKAMEEAKRRRQQAIKTQNIANLLQQYGQGNAAAPSIEENGDNSGEQQNMLSAYMQQAASLAALVSTTTPRPSSAPSKKRKYYCKEGDKIADQTSINNYFVCYKNAQGQMRGHKMTCSKGLIFCPKSTMCTLASKCA